MKDDPRESTSELRCVAPLVVLGPGGMHLLGPCLLITNGAHTIAAASSAVLRTANEPLAILTRLDGATSIRVTSWQLARHAALGIIELGEGVAFGPEIQPLHLSLLSAAVETRGAPSALVTVRPAGVGFAREVIGVRIELDDGGGASDELTRLVSPIDPVEAGTLVDGSPMFAWMPPDPVLGRTSEVIAVAIGVVSRARTAPGTSNAIAELVGLEAAGRALSWDELTPPPSNELAQISGEIALEARARKE
ncbi:hypothetical protein BH11MYX1_BH11MYX1_46000 [soil metagenome]